MTADYWRQEELVRLDQLQFPIALAGAGGIGSPVGLALAKLGCGDITVHDPDRVEPHNLPNQLYGPADLGRSKVDALGDILERLTGRRPQTRVQRLAPGPHAGVIVAAVDSMAARAQIWADSVRMQPAVRLFVDARMGGEVGRIVVVTPSDPDDVERYESTLHGDDEADPEVCFQQAVGYSTLVVAGLVAAVIRRFAVGEQPPFETIVDLATLTLLSRSAEGALRG